MTQDEVDAILAADKVITGNLRWSKRALGGDRQYIDLHVLVPETSELLVPKGSRHPTRPNFSFTLLWRGVPIRKFTAHHQHTNPDGQVIREPHKHRWTPEDADEWAYIPDDIRTGNIDQALIDFLTECHIRLRTPFQIGLN